MELKKCESKMKNCVVCNKHLTGRSITCGEECKNKYKIKYHSNYRAKNSNRNYPSKTDGRYNERARKKREDIKKIVLQHYSVGPICCKKCGYTDIRALCLDHVNSDGKHRQNARSSGYPLYFRLMKNNYPEDMQVLCANCNLIKQHELKEWGKGRKRNEKGKDRPASDSESAAVSVCGV